MILSSRVILRSCITPSPACHPDPRVIPSAARDLLFFLIARRVEDGVQ
jgi:hypothetical protein